MHCHGRGDRRAVSRRELTLSSVSTGGRLSPLNLPPGPQTSSSAPPAKHRAQKTTLPWETSQNPAMTGFQSHPGSGPGGESPEHGDSPGRGPLARPTTGFSVPAVGGSGSERRVSKYIPETNGNRAAGSQGIHAAVPPSTLGDAVGIGLLSRWPAVPDPQLGRWITQVWERGRWVLRLSHPLRSDTRLERRTRAGCCGRRPRVSREASRCRIAPQTCRRLRRE